MLTFASRRADSSVKTVISMKRTLRKLQSLQLQSRAFLFEVSYSHYPEPHIQARYMKDRDSELKEVCFTSRVSELEYNIKVQSLLGFSSVIIKVDGTCVPAVPSNGTDFSLEEAQKAVDGYIDVLRLTDDRIMVVNDEGAINGMEYNRGASKVYQINRGVDVMIYGNVLVCNTDMLL